MKSQLKKVKSKSVRKKKSPITLAKEKADKALQDWGRLQNKPCEICGGKYSCLHHFFPKSSSNNLRYDKNNCIFICAGCHFTHHNGNPIPHATVIEKRGKEWYEYLKKKRFEYVKANIAWYNENRLKYENNRIQSDL